LQVVIPQIPNNIQIGKFGQKTLQGVFTSMDGMSQFGDMSGMGKTVPVPSQALGGLASVASMQPQAMTNMMGNPGGNAGANMMPYLNMQNAMAPQQKQQGQTQATYRQGGHVMMAMGGNPEEEMMAQQGGPQGGLAQAGGMPPPEEDEMASEEGGGELMELAEEMKQEGLQLVYVTPEILQAMVKLLGEPDENPPSGLPMFTSLEQIQQMMAQRKAQGGGGAPQGGGGAPMGGGMPPQMG
jgi:hypothetical protein